MADGGSDDNLRRLLGELDNDPTPPPETADLPPTSAPRNEGADRDPEPVLEIAGIILDPPTRPGTLGRIGPYHVVKKLGEGGFGVVFAAETETSAQCETSEGATFAQVAIKVLRPEVASDIEFRERFRREARCAAIRDPLLVRVFKIADVEREREGTTQSCPVIEMEWVRGESLRDRLDREEHLTPEGAARLLLPVARAVAVLHQREICHRDIKPGNILLADSGAVKVGDFGLARPWTGSDATITGTGQLLGTMPYMAPECFRPNSNQDAQAASKDRPDPLRDLYSLGVVLYEVLTGMKPFRDSGPALTRQIVEDDPLPPHAIRTGIPAALEAVCLRLLEKKPNDRKYQDAGELADDLERFLKGDTRSMVAKPYHWTERVARLWRRKKAVIVGLLLQVGTSLLAFVGMFAALILLVQTVGLPPWPVTPIPDPPMKLFSWSLALIAFAASLRVVIESWRGIPDILRAIVGRVLGSQRRTGSDLAGERLLDRSEGPAKVQHWNTPGDTWWRSTGVRFWVTLMGASLSIFVVIVISRWLPAGGTKGSSQPRSDNPDHMINFYNQVSSVSDLSTVERLREAVMVDVGLSLSEKRELLGQLALMEESIKRGPLAKQDRLALAAFFRAQEDGNPKRTDLIKLLEARGGAGNSILRGHEWSWQDKDDPAFVGLLVNALASGDPRVRQAAAAEMMPLTKKPWVIWDSEYQTAAVGLLEPLGNLLRDSREPSAVRFTALCFLVCTKSENPEKIDIDRLFDGVLEDRDSRVRLTAAEAVWARSKGDRRRRNAALTAIRSVLWDQDPRLRVDAAVSFWERTTWSPDSPTVRILLNVARDKGVDAETRVLAVNTLWEQDRSQVKSVVEVLRDVLRSCSDDAIINGRAMRTLINGRAMRTLSETGSEAGAALTEILAVLEDVRKPTTVEFYKRSRRILESADGQPKEFIRIVVAGYMHRTMTINNSIRALRWCEPSVARRVLREIIKDVDEDPWVRGEAALALVETGAPEALPLLVGHLNGNDTKMTAYAIEAIGKMGPSAAPATKVLVSRLADGDKIRIEAIRALGAIGPPARDALPALLPLTKDGQWEVKLAALEAVAKIDRSLVAGAGPDLERILADHSIDASRRAIIARAIGMIDPQHTAKAAATLGEMIEEAVSKKDRDLVDEPLTALVALGPGAKAAVPSLAANLLAFDPDQIVSAAHILSEVGPQAREACDVLEKVTHHRRGDVREAAENALRKIDPSFASPALKR